jgi:hypothetical protein
LKQYGHIFEAENYLPLNWWEWFWPQKVSTSLFECIQKAKGDANGFDQLRAGYVDKVACILEAAIAKGVISK